jgi:hypothetical protein
MNPLYIYFIIFFCIGYLIVTDASVARLFVLLTSLVRIQYQRIKWWVLYNPANPIVKWLMWRNALRLAKELAKELNK